LLQPEPAGELEVPPDAWSALSLTKDADGTSGDSGTNHLSLHAVLVNLETGTPLAEASTLVAVKADASAAAFNGPQDGDARRWIEFRRSEVLGGQSGSEADGCTIELGVLAHAERNYFAGEVS
jgi:hypothetical protein